MMSFIKNMFVSKPANVLVSKEVLEKKVLKAQKTFPNRLKKAKAKLGDKYILSPANKVKRLTKQAQRMLNLI